MVKTSHMISEALTGLVAQKHMDNSQQLSWKGHEYFFLLQPQLNYWKKSGNTLDFHKISEIDATPKDCFVKVLELHSRTQQTRSGLDCNSLVCCKCNSVVCDRPLKTLRSWKIGPWCTARETLMSRQQHCPLVTQQKPRFGRTRAKQHHGWTTET
jgi:hypothetical protein